jgi:hypothetical protein
VATGEVLLFAAAMGAAVALSRTPPAIIEEEESAAQALLGFPTWSCRSCWCLRHR